MDIRHFCPKLQAFFKNNISEVWHFPPWIHAKPRSCCFHVFKGEIYQNSNQEQIVKDFKKHCLKHINGKRIYKGNILK